MKYLKIILFLCYFIHSVISVSDLRKCADIECKEIISYGKALVTYMSNNEYTLSFKKNADIIIYSKSAGSDKSLWGVSINGVRGYVNKEFIKEMKKVNKIKFEVPTEYYEVIDDQLVPKKSKKKTQKDVFVAESGEREKGSCPLEKNNIVEGSEEIVDSKMVENTEDLEMPEIINKPAMLSGVSGEIIPNKIKASPTHTVIDGTTLPVSFDQEPSVGYTDNEDKESYQSEEKKIDNDYSHESLLQQDNTKHDLAKESVSQSDEQVSVDTKNLKSDNVVTSSESPKNIPLNEIPNSPPLVDSTASNPVDSKHDIPVSEHEPTLTPSIHSDSNNESLIPDLTENLQTNGSSDISPENTNALLDDPTQTILKKDVPPVMLPVEDIKVVKEESPLLNYPNAQDNSYLIPPLQDPLTTDQIIDPSKKEDIDKDTLVPLTEDEKIMRKIKEEFVFNEVDANVVTPKIDEEIAGREEKVTTVNQDEIVIKNNNNEKIEEIANTPILEKVNNFDLNTTDSDQMANNDSDSILDQTNNVNISESTSSTENIDIAIPSEDIDTTKSNNMKVDSVLNAEHNQPDIVLSSFTESPQSHTTFSSSSDDIPVLSNILTESPISQYYTTSSIPSYTLLEPVTTPSPPLYQNTPPAYQSSPEFQNTPPEYHNAPANQNIDTSNEINNNGNNIYDFYTEANIEKNIAETTDNINELISNSVEENIEATTESFTDSTNESFESVDSGDSFITNIFKSFGSITDQALGFFKSNVKIEEEVVIKPHWSEEKLSGDVDRVVGGWNSFIASFLPAYSALPQCRPEENVIAMTEVSTDLVMWLIISAVSVLAFTLGYYFLENRKQDGKLLAMVNSVQKELLCSTKECILLKDELTITKEKLEGIEDSSFGSNEMVACLKKEIADAQHTITELQERLSQTEEELANSTEAALELQAILDEQLSSKDTSNSSLTFTVTNLQAQLDEQQTTMNLTKSQLAAKVEENEVLLGKILEMGNKTTSLEKELMETHNQLRQAREEYENQSQQLHELSTTMEKSLQQLKDQKTTEIKDLRSQLKNGKSELESSKVLLKARAHEVATLQENLKLLKLDSKNIESLIDASRTSAELTQVTTEKNILNEKLEKEQSLLHELTNKMEVQESQIKLMREQQSEAEQKAIQATSRLEVLTNYFNQKEAELIKELNTKEGLWLSQQGENMSTAEKIQSLQQEIQQYKETTESVRRELAEQEAAWRARNAALEKRAHEQWLARRAAERQAEAAASEAQSLRQRLAAPSPIDKPQGMVSPLNSIEGVGELPLLPPPPLPFPPFPHLGGLPPPPFLPPPLPSHRPPPLGRLSSPPPLPPQHMRHDRYSPESRYSADRDRDYSPDRRSTPQHRGRSPYSPDGRRRQYNSSRRYDDDRYYDSGDDRRSHRRYDETETDFSPPPTPPNKRRGVPNHNKGVSSGSGQSSESLERISKHSNKY